MAFDVEQLFGAVDILIERKLENVNFDKTIICTIVDDSDKKNGCYIVSDGTIKFKAYVSDATYNKDDQVRVSILNGDFTEKKFIVGRYTKDEDTKPITYKYPLDTIIPITGNLIDPSLKNNVYSLRANSNTITKNIWQINLSEDQSFKDLQSNGIYNTITLKADFKTLLSSYDLVSGNYGLRLDLFIQPSADNPTQRIRKYITLDSSEMMGNPYSFFLYSTQAKKVDIMSTGIITEMVLWMYQSVDGDGKSSRFIDRNKHELTPNIHNDDIFVKNIEIGFGSDVTKVADNTLELFTSSSQQYKYSDDSDANNLKEMEILWYNKTDENKYIGFSDGLFDLAYDEIDYLKKSNQDSRLVAQVGRTDIPSDESGLELAADHKDMKPIMVKAKDALTREVADVLYGLQRQVKGINSINTKLDSLLNTVDGNLVKQWNLADEAFEAWDDTYSGVLQYAYDKQNKIENPSSWNSKWETDYYKQFIAAVKKGISSVREFFTWMEKATALPPAVTQEDKNNLDFATQMGYRGDYDLYSYRTEKELIMIENWLDQLDSYLVGNYEKLIAYKSSEYVFTEYAQKDFSSYGNKYCIYWYRYERGYKLEYQKDGNNDDYNYGNFMGDGWKRIEITDNQNNILLNFGVPRESIINPEDGKAYYPAKPLGQTYCRKMDKNLIDEKYAVVLFYNHVMYKSNIITFTNSEPDLIPNDILIDQRDALKIEHDVYSQEHYQSYNEFNLLKSLEDGGKIRQLKCFYDGLYKKDEALIDAGLYWYIPNHSTMLTFDKDDLIKKGFSTDADVKTEKSIPGYTYFYKKIRQCDDKDKVPNELGELEYTCRNEDRYFFYKIKPSLEKDATNNTIKVKAYLKDVEHPVEGDITMTFSTFGTNGTKYTLSIVPAGSQNSVIGKDYPLQLSVKLKDSKNNPINIVDKANMSEENAYGFSIENWNNLPNAFNITTLYDDTKTYVQGLKVSLKSEQELSSAWDAENPYFGIINAKVSFRMDKDEFNSEQDEADKVSEYQKYQVVDLNTLYAITYSSSGMYYMSGATNIVYNNQGTVSFVSEDEYVLYTVNDAGNVPVENQVWRMEYYDKNGNWIDESYEDKNTGERPWDMLINYMPVLNSENRLTPAPLYIEGLDYVPVVVCMVNGDVAWVQPIIITQNRYASSTLNDWNGSLTIDEKNGTILSTAVGAGKKEADNSFSGVLMGDIGRGMNFDSDNMSGIGLYGFHSGAQSFCLSAEGTAFFGKAGRGRIYFDGTSGTISSASYEAVKRTGNPLQSAGMMIDLDDGFIHMLGAQYVDHTYSPDYPDGKTSQAEVLISTGLMNGEKDAYFKIRSKDQPNAEHYLMYVDTDTYYLQTDNYVPTEYSPSDASGNIPSGQGMHLDLKTGFLDAYNFKLVTKNVYIDSNDDSNAFFIIKDNAGINLLYAGTDGATTGAKEVYYLKSGDFNETSRTGTKINLTDGSIVSYDFTLQAGNTTKNKPTIELISGGTPFLRIRNDDDKTLLSIQKKTTHPETDAVITDEEFYLQSGNYSSGSSGTRIDLVNNTLKAYSGFTLKAYKSGTTQYILLDATATDYPLKIYGSSAKYFQVNWNGGLEATGATITGTINATSGEFSGNITVSGTLDGGTITGAAIYGATIANATENPTFSVNSSGHLIAASANIGGWNVSSGSGGFNYGDGTLYVSPTSGLKFTDKFMVDAEGNLKATSAVFDTSLTVKAKRGGDNVLTVSSTGATAITGKLTIGTSDKGADLDIYGSITISTNQWIYLSSLGTSGARINSSGGKQIAMYAETGIFLHAPYIALNHDVAYTNYALTIPTPSEIYVAGINKSLEAYVEESAGVSKITNTDGSKIIMVAKARNLVNSSGTITLAAPSSTGSAGQVLKTTDKAGTTAWATLGATLVNFTDTTTVDGPYTSGTNTYYKVKVDYDKSGSVTAPAQKGSVEVKYPGYWLCWDTDSTGGRIKSTEYSAASYDENWVASRYKYYTFASSRTYTKSYTTEAQTVTYEASGTTEGQVQINVSLT